MSEWKVTKREIGFYDDEPKDKKVGNREFVNFSRTFAGAALKNGSNPVLFIDSGRQVFSKDGKHKGMEQPIPESESGPMRGIVNRVRMIRGDLYIAGGHRSVCRRSGVNDWESMCYDLPVPTLAEHEDVERLRDMSFIDIDGFNAEDMYVVAGRGVVWHLQGQHWKRVAFPSNMFLESVCCGGDGQVYIGAQSGTVFRGRGERWEMIHRGDMTLPFKDMVWHAGQLWCTSDYGLWTLQDGQIVSAHGQMPSEVFVCAGNLSVADGVMLMAGRNGAAYHDGSDWRLIFNTHQMEQRTAGKTLDRP